MNYVPIDSPAQLTLLLRPPTYFVAELPNMAVIGEQARRYLLETHAVSIRRPLLRERLAALARRWTDETAFSSSLADKRSHPAFAEIVNLGDEAVPLILELLEARPSFLFMALHEITRENPVPEEHHGRIGAIIEDWLRWGTEHDHRQ